MIRTSLQKKKMTRIIAGISLCVAGGLLAAEPTGTAPAPANGLAKTDVPLAAPTFTVPPTILKTAGTFMVNFTVSQKTDVEVAILGADGKVLRHLVAGMLGGATPPPAPLKAGLAQSMEWDGKDDYRQMVANPAACSVRVRAGMGVVVKQIVGGDPYAFFSREMSSGDHAAFTLTGVEAKADGKVYVMGNANNYGPPAIRQYDAVGNFERTVFPPPAGKPVADVKGWGVNVQADGSYSYKYSNLEFPALSTTLISWGRAYVAFLLPTPDKDKLTLRCHEQGHRQMTIGTDGSLSEYKPMAPFSEPPMPKGLAGSFFSAHSPDGKTLYVSGLFEPGQTSGFWRGGQVWKVDLATRKASVFFSLESFVPPVKVEGSYYTQYSALHGVAVDAENRVLVCDRQNNRIVALDKEGKIIREFPVVNPDAIALDPGSKALYVTTRAGTWHKPGELKLLKFNDWMKDSEPVATVALGASTGYSPETFLALCKDKGNTMVWVGYTALPVRIFRDKGNSLELEKDFYEAGFQRTLDLQHIVVDPATEDVYLPMGFGQCYRINDWKAPKFVCCMQDEKTPLKAVSLAIDPRARRLYTHSHMSGVGRFKMEGGFFTPDPVAAPGSHVLTPPICNDWRIRLGMGDRGIAVAPDGSLATLGAQGGANYFGPLTFYKHEQDKAPWQPLPFDGFGAKACSGGVRFDFKGNLYAGKTDKQGGCIYKYAPTGSFESGNLFPAEPAAPAKVYEVNYGPFSGGFSRTPRFGVDGYGRLYSPTALESKITVIDNEGNTIFRFGTYGNRDSMGGLAGDLVPTPDVPMAYPNSVDVTDDYIYVGDMVNIRLMRIAKTYKLDASAKIQER